jgi:hypothetical protein
MVISITGYEQARNEDKQKITILENDMELLKEGMNRLFLLVQQNPVLAHVKPEVLDKTKDYR